jgi:hypothetical protein
MLDDLVKKGAEESAALRLDLCGANRYRKARWSAAAARFADLAANLCPFPKSAASRSCKPANSAAE